EFSMKPTLDISKNSPENAAAKMRLKRWLDMRELSFLLILFTLIGSLWALAEAVIEGDTNDFDRTVLLSMRNPADLSDPIGPLWVEEIGRDITALGGNAVLTLLTLAVVGFLVLNRKRRIALILVVATLGALSVSTLLKHTID